MTQPPRPPKPRRFYKTVSVEEVPGGFALLLDGRAVRTPGRCPLAAPTRPLAAAIAAEWAAQDEEIEPQTMPLTRFANGVLDHAEGAPEPLVAAVLDYARTDLLRHRAERPPELAGAQAEAWDPWLDWAEEVLGASLPAVTGVLPAETPAAALVALRARMEELDPWRLTALAQAVSLTGSAVLGFALLEGAITAGEAFAVSRVDEDFQAARWGQDAEAAARAESVMAELAACETLLRLL